MSKTIRNLENVASSAGVTSPRFRNFARGNDFAIDSMNELGFPISNRVRRQANILRTLDGHTNADKFIGAYSEMDWNRPFIVSFGFLGDAFGANQIEVLAKNEYEAERLAIRTLREQMNDDFAIDEVYLKTK